MKHKNIQAMNSMNWTRVLRFTAPTLGLSAALGGLVAVTLGSGCTSKGPTTSDSPAASTPQSSALQVSSSANAPAYASASPVDAGASRTPAVAGTDASAQSSYTVQKGDTLFRIAKEHYGDGKQWTRIAGANPGLTPATLKAGQTIVVP